MTDITALLAELERLTAADRTPFPYDDCRKLLNGADSHYSGLIPDLDYYFSELAGYRSHGSRIRNWSEEKVETVLRSLERSFTDRHPIYADLLAEVVDGELADALEIAEQTRATLRALLAEE